MKWINLREALPDLGRDIIEERDLIERNLYSIQTADEEWLRFANMNSVVRWAYFQPHESATQEDVNKGYTEDELRLMFQSPAPEPVGKSDDEILEQQDKEFTAYLKSPSGQEPGDRKWATDEDMKAAYDQVPVYELRTNFTQWLTTYKASIK